MELDRVIHLVLRDGPLLRCHQGAAQWNNAVAWLGANDFCRIRLRGHRVELHRNRGGGVQAVVDVHWDIRWAVVVVRNLRAPPRRSRDIIAAQRFIEVGEVVGRVLRVSE